MSPSPPLRLAHVSPFPLSRSAAACGGERYVRNVALALRRAGLEGQTLFVPGQEEAACTLDGVEVRVLRCEPATPGGEAAVPEALWRALPGFDLVHVHHALTLFGTFCLAVARSLGIPAVGTDLGGEDSYLLLQRGGINLLDGVVSVSRFAHDRLAAQYQGRHEIVRPPVDTAFFSPDPKTARDPRTVLCVGRMAPGKGQDRVIAALPPDLRLVLAGAVGHEGYARRLRRMARGRQVRFVHGADDAALLGLYRSAGLLVQAPAACAPDGRVDAAAGFLGLAALEAMSCGLPVAVADTGALPELSPGPGALRVFSGEADLAAVLRDCARGAWPGPGAGRPAREHVAAGFGLEATGARLLRFYAAVLRDRGRKA